MNAWGALAALLSCVAVLAWRPPHGWTVRHRLLLSTPMTWRRPRGGALVLAAGAATVCVALLDVAAPTIAGAAAAGVGLFVVHQVRAQRARSAQEATRLEVCAALDMLAAELRAGILPARAVASAATTASSLQGVERVARAGGDVPAALTAAAVRPGAQAWAALASAWTVAERAGAPLADVVLRLSDTVRDDLELVREVASEAAPARATGRLMAVLPVLGLGLGAGMGADPVHLLTQTVPGALCLAAGAGLACLGTWWVDRVVASAEAAP